MNKAAAIVFTVSLILCLALPAWSEQGEDVVSVAGIVENGTESRSSERRFLLLIGPPVTGYKSTHGVIYDLIPLGVEIPVHKRIGISFRSSLVYYKSDFQSFDLFVGLPVYFKESSRQEAYHGFYIEPVIGGAVDLTDSASALGVGLESGYSWQMKGDWRFSTGLRLSYLSSSPNIITVGLNLELGYWI